VSGRVGQREGNEMRAARRDCGAGRAPQRSGTEMKQRKGKGRWAGSKLLPALLSKFILFPARLWEAPPSKHLPRKHLKGGLRGPHRAACFSGLSLSGLLVALEGEDCLRWLASQCSRAALWALVEFAAQMAINNCGRRDRETQREVKGG